MRVTHRSLQDAWVRDLQQRLGALDRLNRQIGSGKKIQSPADDPAGASRIVRIDELIARNEQYMKNIEEALAVHRSTESALEQVYTRLVRAKSLAVEGANDASAPLSGSYAALADEVAGIREGILQLARTRHEDEYLFNGTAGEKIPFAAEAGGIAYQGNSHRLRVNAGNGQTVPVNLPGDMAFRETEARSRDLTGTHLDFTGGLTFTVSDGSSEVAVSLTRDYTGNLDNLAADLNAQLEGRVNVEAAVNEDGTISLRIADTASGGEISLEGTEPIGIASGTRNVFGLLDELEAALRAEDSVRTEGLLSRFDRALHDLLTQRGVVGARSRSLEMARQRLEAANLTGETLRADIEGVDVAEAVTRLSAEEQAYQTALAAGARLFNISILDFLR